MKQNPSDRNNNFTKVGNLSEFADKIKYWGLKLGFQQVGICDIDVSQHKDVFLAYINEQRHGQMSFLSRNVDKRFDPSLLHPNTCRIISVRMDYLPPKAKFAETLGNDKQAYVSRYAGGRDYHKLMRNRLKQLGEKISTYCEALNFRPFVDSAPVLEHAIAEKAGLGWTGKHTLTLNEHAGSWFFLGELFVNIPLPVDAPVKEQCGTCSSCITICPTQAIVAPYKLDARKCISYLTIEHDGVIDEQYRKPIGNRVYGCDDCQLVCPWNRYADLTKEIDFHTREQLQSPDLITLFEMTENEFLDSMAGSPIRRIGYQKWRRNLSIAMGNANKDADIIASLESALSTTNDEVLKEHFTWALHQQLNKTQNNQASVASRQHQRLIRIVEKGLPRDA